MPANRRRELADGRALIPRHRADPRSPVCEWTVGELPAHLGAPGNAHAIQLPVIAVITNPRGQAMKETSDRAEVSEPKTNKVRKFSPGASKPCRPPSERSRRKRASLRPAGRAPVLKLLAGTWPTEVGGCAGSGARWSRGGAAAVAAAPRVGDDIRPRPAGRAPQGQRPSSPGHDSGRSLVLAGARARISSLAVALDRSTSCMRQRVSCARWQSAHVPMCCLWPHGLRSAPLAALRSCPSARTITLGFSAAPT